MKSAGKDMDVDAPEMNFGSKPTDGGYLLLSQAELTRPELPINRYLQGDIWLKQPIYHNWI